VTPPSGRPLLEFVGLTTYGPDHPLRACVNVTLRLDPSLSQRVVLDRLLATVRALDRELRAAGPTDHDDLGGPTVSQLYDVRTRLRAADDRVPLVERRLLAARLGLAGDDLDLLLNATVTDLLELPASVTITIGASRLLAELDAHVARAHPVDLSYPHDPEGEDAPSGVVVATVPVGDDDVRRLVLEDDVIHVPHDVDPCSEELTPDDAEALAYALLRLVSLARDRATYAPTSVDDRDAARAEVAAAYAAHRDGSLRRRVEAELAEELP
jgi:hypothetical protein